MITLTKNKIIYSNDYDPECSRYVEKEVDCLCMYLEEVIKLSEDFTLEDLFKHIEREKEVCGIVFSSALGHHFLQPYLDEIKKPRLEQDNEIDYLELRRYGERWSWGDIDLFISFSGVNEKTDMGHAIELTPLNELKHLPLRLNENFSISEITVHSRIVRYLIRLSKKIGFSLKKWDNFGRTYVEGKTKFTVYELLSAVLSEISFCGDPEERDAKLTKIKEDVEDAMKRYGDIDEEKANGKQQGK